MVVELAHSPTKDAWDYNKKESNNYKYMILCIYKEHPAILHTATMIAREKVVYLFILFIQRSFIRISNFLGIIW